MCHSRGRACPARGSARPPFNGQLPLTPRAGHARPLPRGCHRLPRRGQDPSLRTIVHGCFVGSGLDRSAGWADVYGWPVGAAYMPPGTFAAAGTPRAAYMRPLQTVPKNGVGGLVRRGGIHAARDACGGGSSAGRIYAAPTNRSEKWRLRLVCRGGIHASREPCAAANTPGGINPSPTHCPQAIFCMAGRRGRRPLRGFPANICPPLRPGPGIAGL